MAEVADLVRMSRIGKRYGGVQACREVDFTLGAGEVHALLGENGAGKSTLMKILSGDVTEYDGQIEINGRNVSFAGPTDAQAAGIAMIHQELDLVPGLSVADNIFLGRELRTRWKTVDRRRMEREARTLLERSGVNLDPRRPVGELRVGEQQLVTIAKAISLDARVLIMDEPTSALTTSEVERLFVVIRELRRGGVGIVYISHRMEEIAQVADRATVLRNGQFVSSFDPRKLSTAEVVEAMVGRPVQTMFTTPDAATGDELLRVDNLVLKPRRPRPGRRDPDGISLTVRSGEIVGLAGLLGAGRTELLETLYGVAPGGARSGRIVLQGKEIQPRSPRHALSQGIGFVPEDRRTSGLVLFHSILANTVVSSLPAYGRLGVIARRMERAASVRMADRLRLKFGRLQDDVGTLSGGNQQKVVFGRMLLTEPRLLLLDEPTRGVDIGAKSEIYRLLGELAGQGIGVLLASSELPELVGVCDRVVVLRDGRDVASFSTADSSEGDLLAAAMGDRAVFEGRAVFEEVGGPQ
ncbi:ribose transport system ATP-binding protein [Kribbella orskensis]|uniref:Ribose transport system ATP-binding protein n=1 Tax=Kribbella orskensis TaxID=2512216 RepID=A0ABY2BU42_9ACTN|nr:MULTISPECIES: sugar ABC transporter ATP-binding protein [Kribbella]TCN44487.1 ribose transport system ATP-binding protein [Kribbella sp. VKM Ac-2500]TCO31735.1 ribose transport system ATP-binding protein [Kribbella orskensis]